jgi:hypothetical protein
MNHKIILVVITQSIDNIHDEQIISITEREKIWRDASNSVNCDPNHKKAPALSPKQLIILTKRRLYLSPNRQTISEILVRQSLILISMAQLELIPGAISEMLVSTSTTKVLTLADRYGLQAAIMNEFIGDEELRAINRLIRYIIKGRIQVVDQISHDEYLGFWVTGLK